MGGEYIPIWEYVKGNFWRENSTPRTQRKTGTKDRRNNTPTPVATPTPTTNPRPTPELTPRKPHP
jgi:hypothetical protein